MVSSYGKTSGFTAVGSDELMLVNGGKGGGGGGGGGGGSEYTSNVAPTQTYLPGGYSNPQPQNGISTDSGITITSGNTTVNISNGITAKVAL